MLKDGSLPRCIDYSALNIITVEDKYPLPRRDDVFDWLKGAQVFSSIDVHSRYYQIRIAEQDVQKTTAFRSHEGLYDLAYLMRQLHSKERCELFSIIYLLYVYTWRISLHLAQVKRCPKAIYVKVWNSTSSADVHL